MRHDFDSVSKRSGGFESRTLSHTVMIRTMIVDDVALAREAIRIRLQENKDFEVVGEAATAPEALALIRKLSPDLIFLDIEMPGLDAFQLLDDLDPGRAPEVIFVTAHDQYAVQAFNSSALHFLLKPINDSQFDEAIRRAREEIGASKSENDAPDREIAGAAEDKPRYWSRLVIKDHDRFILLSTEEVHWIGSATNYAEVHAGTRSYLLRMPISDLEARLDPWRFARISRSTIVNVQQVEEIKALWHGDFEVFLKDGTALRMSRRYRERLLSHG
jgi:two-component system LytT family response regulator